MADRTGPRKISRNPATRTIVNILPIGRIRMEPTTFLEHYRICTSEAGREVSRTGAAINYKAIDTRTHDRVCLQLIPLTSIEPEKLAQLKERAETAEKLDHVNIAKTIAVGVDHDYFVVVSEHFEGETADSWIVENGPMAADAALRIGLQVVRALGAAAYFNLTHRAIQPSNLMIAPGESPDGGWPFVKLLNFGLASLELHSDSAEARELAPSISPQFASPEQRANGEIDFRSEMYSLGATMCFLLTGAAPLAVSGMKARLRIQRLPELRRAPKPLHNLLVYLLREDPNNRPQDPVLLEEEMRDCLTKIERRQALGRKLGISLAAVVPRKSKEAKRPTSPVAQVLGGFAAVIILLLAAAAGAEYFFPDKIPFLHRDRKPGVQIGVPDAAKFAATPAQSPGTGPMVANAPQQNPSPAIAEANQHPPADSAQSQQTTEPGTTTPAVASNQTATAVKQPEPPSPAFGPSEPPSQSTKTPENADQSATASSDESSTQEKSQGTASTSSRKSTSRTASRNRDSYVDQFEERPVHPRRHHAEVVGHTHDGRLIVRLSSGRVIVLPRVNEQVYPSYPRRRGYVERPDDFIPPSQPFDPDD
jgi:serine/threonine protein kinase